MEASQTLDLNSYLANFLLQDKQQVGRYFGPPEGIFPHPHSQDAIQSSYKNNYMFQVAPESSERPRPPEYYPLPPLIALLENSAITLTDKVKEYYFAL